MSRCRDCRWLHWEETPECLHPGLDMFDGVICAMTAPNAENECGGFAESGLTDDMDEPEADAVNHPAHYTRGGVECIDIVRAALSDGFGSWLRGNVLKYVWRYDHKGSLEDLRKARWYLDCLIDDTENASGEPETPSDGFSGENR